jgi:arylsulfatase A-like enzyme
VIFILSSTVRAFALGCLVFLSVARGEAIVKKPNVLFIICDDLNTDLGCYGDPQMKTPNIDRLAARGVRFSNAFCQYPLCGPSRASFMTGLYPDQSLIRGNAIRIRERVPNVVTMSQMFRNNGWQATRIGKVYHYNVPRDIGTDGHDDPDSWDEVVNPSGRDKTDESMVVTLIPGQYGATLSWLRAEGSDNEQTDGIAATEAIARIKAHAPESKPFFLAVGLYRPHTPYVAPEKYFDLYPVDAIKVPAFHDELEKTIPPAAFSSLRVHKEQINLNPQTSREVIQGYHASISFADTQVGRILDALDESGLAANTIVVFTSDHGYHMGQMGHWQKLTLYDQGTRVPFIIAAPGKSAAGGTACPAEMLDFYPTLAELCGLKPPATIQGVSLVPVLNDAAARPRVDALTVKDPDGASLRTERFRYTEWGKDGVNGRELYDHKSDPEELHNLAGDAASAAVIAELAPRLRLRLADAAKAPAGLEQLKVPVKRKK